MTTTTTTSVGNFSKVNDFGFNNWYFRNSIIIYIKIRVGGYEIYSEAALPISLYTLYAHAYILDTPLSPIFNRTHRIPNRSFANWFTP